MNNNIFQEPIDHILTRAGFCSLRSASSFIKNNKIFINCKKVSARNQNADIENDIISVNETVLPQQKHIYLMMNKPLNYVCSTVSDSHKTVYSLIPDKIKNSLNGAVLHTIGRLDADSTGLLLFTTNGRLSNYFTNPAYHVEKTYLVGLKNAASTEEQFLYKNAFSTGITLPEYKHGSAFTTKPAEIQFTDEKNCIILISEGKFRQIRRMIYALGNEVTALKRIKMGGIAMPDDLSEGEFVEIGRESFAECV